MVYSLSMLRENQDLDPPSLIAVHLHAKFESLL
jgi:hypothetical protein